VGCSRALEICATARWVDAEEGMALGLATVVVPREQLTDRALELCGAILANPPAAVSAVKKLVARCRSTRSGRAGRVGAHDQVPLLRALSAGQLS